jgi:amidase
MKSKLAKTSIWLCAAAALVPLPALRAATATFTLETASLSDVRQAMNSGALTSVDLVTMYLNRRNVYDQAGMKLNSVVQINPNAFAEAMAADQRRANGTGRGLIDGLPFLTKDSYNTVGLASTGGMAAWKDIFPTQDNFITAQLKGAGAVLLGHANMDTFATSAGNTVSNAFGATLNAYTLGVPAGSSGGPAVSTAASFTFFAFGGETGGSIRNPSDRGGIVGFKVGVGTIPIGGILALVPDRDVIGPMARYTSDEAAIMDVSVTPDPNDIWAPIDYTPGRPRPSGFVAKQAAATLAGKKIGVISTYVGVAYPGATPTPSTTNTTGVTAISPEISAIFTRARAELQALGATITDTILPPGVDTAVALTTADTVNGSTPPTRKLTVAPFSTQEQAWAHIAYLTGLGQDPVVRLTQAAAVTGTVSTTLLNAVKANQQTTFTSAEGQEHFAAQAIYNKKFEAFMTANGFDALIWPVHTLKTRTGANVPGRDLVNNIGLPLCTVPMGVIPSTGEPTTLGFCGKYRGEADILAMANAYEKATNYRIPSPLAPPLAGESFAYTVATGVPRSAAEAEVGANVVSYAAPTKRAENQPPVVSIAGKGEITATASGDQKLVLSGVAADKSGISAVRVYVNGRRISSKVANGWKASAPLSEVRKWAKGGKIAVIVLAKDAYGNTSATQKVMAVQ